MRPRLVVPAPAIALALALVAAAPAYAIDLRLRGLLDLAAVDDRETVDLNRNNHGDSSFDPWALRLFVDSPLEGGFAVHVQVSMNEEMGVSATGAYLVWTPIADQDLHLTAGKIPMPIGTWAPRTYSNKNPLMSTPMMYQYHTSLSVEEFPPDADALLAAAGTGQQGPDYGNGPGYRGMPILYDRCWDYGVFANGSMRPVEFSFGATNGTPGVPYDGIDDNDGKTLLGRVGVMPWPALRFGMSAAYGPPYPDELEASLPVGQSVEDFDTRLVAADVEVMAGRFEIRAEAFHNVFETPTVGDLETIGGYFETRVGVGSSAWVAGRWDVMRFGDLTGSSGVPRPWDNDMDRIEGGVGYRITRQAIVKAVYQRNIMQVPGAADQVHDLFAAQLSLGF